MDLGPHAVFIWASYAAASAVLGGLIFWLVYDGKRQWRLLTGLEKRGARRRGASQNE